MTRRKRNYTISEEILQGVECRKCHFAKGKYEKMVESGTYYMIYFRCTKCGSEIVHPWHTDKVKRFLEAYGEDF